MSFFDDEDFAPQETAITPTLAIARPVIGDASPQRMAEIIMAYEVAKVRFAEWKRDTEEAIREWLEAHGSVDVGDQTYWSGIDKKAPKVIDAAATLDALMTAVAGDMEALCRHFASEPFRYGAVRATFEAKGVAFDQHFRTEEVAKLMNDDAEKVKRRLQKSDKRFMK